MRWPPSFEDKLPEPIPTDTHTNPRKLFVAGCLSSILPGSGQLVRSQTCRGAIWLGTFAALATTSVALKPWTDPATLVLAIFLGMVLGTASACDAAFRGSANTRSRKLWTTAAFVVLAYLAAVYGSNGLWSLRGFRLFEVPSTAMQPTIQPGDRIIADMHAYRSTSPANGEIVVLLSPDKVWTVKRVIGSPGDKVEGRDGLVYRNAVRLSEPYVRPLENARRSPKFAALRDFGPVILQADQYYVVGDNRDVSYDSRIQGPVSVANIRGRMLYVLYSKH